MSEIVFVVIYLMLGKSVSIICNEYIEKQTKLESIFSVLLFPFVLMMIAYLIVLIPVGDKDATNRKA
jgi:cytochrome bd-type quinol oxidase subunit 2